MSIHGKVSVWKITPDKFNQVLQNPGMDLGKPDRIDDPVNLVYTALGINDVEHSKKQSERVKKAHRARKPIIDLQLYAAAKADGMTDIEIAARYEIKLSTLKAYLAKWRSEAQ